VAVGEVLGCCDKDGNDEGSSDGALDAVGDGVVGASVALDDGAAEIVTLEVGAFEIVGVSEGALVGASVVGDGVFFR
jgi:hypothetical protein